jgi:ferric iron reductase protein FhuF
VIPLLQPLFQGDWARYAETLACDPPPADAHSLIDLIAEGGPLASVLHRQAEALRCADLRPVASAWSLDYLWALLPPVVAAASVLQHVFPVRANTTRLLLGPQGEPLRFHIADEGRQLAGAPVALRYDDLLWHHLQSLFAALHPEARVPLKILWSNAARYLEEVLEQALHLTGGAPHIEHDRLLLLDSPRWPDGRPNPLHLRRREAPCIQDDETRPLKLHRECCLYYRLPGEDYCGACPLAPQHRRVRGSGPVA